MDGFWRSLVLFGAPIFVGVLNLAHPMVMVPVYQGIAHQINWWLALHFLNLVGFPLVGLAAFILVKNVKNRAARFSKIGIAVFIPIYAAFDALAGIGTGTLVQAVGRHVPNSAQSLEPVVDAYWGSGSVALVAIVGSIAWTIAMLAAAVALTEPDRRRLVAALAIAVFFGSGLARSTMMAPDGSNIQPGWWMVVLAMALVMYFSGRPGLPAALLTLAGTLFAASHVAPTGPLAMACFLAAAIVVDKRKWDGSVLDGEEPPESQPPGTRLQ